MCNLSTFDPKSNNTFCAALGRAAIRWCSAWLIVAVVSCVLSDCQQARATCGDWLAHPETMEGVEETRYRHTAADLQTRAAGQNEVVARSLLTANPPRPMPRPCSGPHCSSAPYRVPIVPSVATNRMTMSAIRPATDAVRMERPTGRAVSEDPFGHPVANRQRLERPPEC